jgi:ribosomal protein S18 acetylase RimI-like enzyme
MLMQAAREFASSTGAAYLTLSTQKSNKEARALYEALGYKDERDFLTYNLAL